MEIDVTYNQLVSLKEANSKSIETLLHLLREFWCNNPERQDEVRIGTINVYLDKDDALHLDFSTRFSFENCPKIKDLLGQMGVRKA